MSRDSTMRRLPEKAITCTCRVHSFPTRRSSDLCGVGAGGEVGDELGLADEIRQRSAQVLAAVEIEVLLGHRVHPLDDVVLGEIDDAVGHCRRSLLEAPEFGRQPLLDFAFALEAVAELGEHAAPQALDLRCGGADRLPRPGDEQAQIASQHDGDTDEAEEDQRERGIAPAVESGEHGQGEHRHHGDGNAEGEIGEGALDHARSMTGSEGQGAGAGCRACTDSRYPLPRTVWISPS